MYKFPPAKRTSRSVPQAFPQFPWLPAYGDRRTEALGDDEEGMAHRIFSVLRDADTLGADVLFSEAVEAKGLGLAVMNRLGRAAAFHIIEV